MPRTARDSDDDEEPKTGRRTRNLSHIASVLDSPRRRSTRLKAPGKQNDASPESPLSDNNTTQATRVTRKRVATMDSNTVAEGARKLRPRKTSVSPNNDTEDTEISETATQRTRRGLRNTPSGDTPKTNSRLRRFTRASSEANSPPSAARVVGRIRASSMGPDDAKIETPSRTRRRTSMVPSEQTLVEEAAQTQKVISVRLERLNTEVSTIPEENKTFNQKAEDNTDAHLQDSTEDTEDALKEEQILVQTDPKDIKKDVVATPEKSEAEEVMEASQDVGALVPDVKETKNQSFSETHESSQTSVESNLQDTKSFHLALEVSNDSTEEHTLNSSNKENEEVNANNQVENKITNISSQSSKSLSTTPVNKLVNEKSKSPFREATMNQQQIKKGLNESLNDANTLSEIQSPIVSNVEIVEEHKSVDDKTLNKDDNLSPVKNARKSSEEAGMVVDSEENTSTNTVLLDEKEESTSNKDENTECTSTESVKIGDDVKSIDITDEENAESTENFTKDVKRTQSTEIIDNIEITEISDEDTDELDIIEAVAVVSETESNTVDDVKDESEPMDVSVLEVREILCDNNAAENELSNEAVLKDSSQTDVLNTTNSQSLAETETSTKLTDTNIVTTETNESIVTDGEVSQTTNGDKDMETSKEQTSSKDASQNDTITDTDANNDINDDNDVKNSQSSIVPESQMDPNEESSEKKDGVPEEITTSNTSVRESKNERKSPKKQEKSTEQENSKMEVDQTEFDASSENVFQDITANEWKNDKTHGDTASISSVATEKVENESEAECELVLVDRESGLPAKNDTVTKENETADYDSDDTVVIQSKTMQFNLDNKTCLDTLIEESDEDENLEKQQNVKSPEKKQSNTDGPTKDGINSTKSPKVAKSEEQNENITAAVTKKLKDSSKKSMSKMLLSKSLIMDQTLNSDDDNIDIKSKLNKSDILDVHSAKNRKARTKSVLNVTVDGVVRIKNREESPKNLMDKKSQVTETLSAKKRKSINKSELKESNDNESFEGLNISILNKSQSINSSGKKKMKSKQMDLDSSKKIQDDSEESEANEEDEIATSLNQSKKRKKVNVKKQLTKNHSESDPDEVDSNSESDDSEKIKLPRFLFAESNDTDNEDDESMEGSIDSDVKREYNLDGKNVSKFEDDDVAGDECRASESEYSDPDDDGADLAGFVVDDDEVDEEEEDENCEKQDGNDEEEEENGEEQDENCEVEVENGEEEDEQAEENIKDGNNEEASDENEVSSEEKEEEEEDDDDGDDENNDSDAKDEEMSVSDTNEGADDQKETDSQLFKKQDLESEEKEIVEELNTSKKTTKEKREKVNTSLKSPNVSVESKKKSGNKRTGNEILESIFSKKGKVEESSLKLDFSPRSMTKAEAFDVSVIGTSTPNTKTHLKESKKNKKLNLSSDIVNRSDEKRKSNRSMTDNMIDVSEKEGRETSSKNLSVLAKAEELEKQQAAMDSGRQKKRRKRKQALQNIDTDALEENNTEEDAPVIVSKKRKCIESTPANIPEETNTPTDESSKKKKKNRKKKKETSMDLNSDQVSEPDVVIKEPSHAKSALKAEDTQPNMATKKKSGKIKKVKNVLIPENISVADYVEQLKKNKELETLKKTDNVMKEKRLKKENLTDQQVKVKPSKKSRFVNDTAVNDAPEVVAFSKARDEALKVAKRAAESIKINKEMKKKKQKEHVDKMKSERDAKALKTCKKSESNNLNQMELPKKGIKRLPDDVLEGLSDIPRSQPKKRKISKKEEQILPTRSMSISDFSEANIEVEDSFVPLSSCGSTTQFGVVNLQKIRKQTKVSSTITSFRQKMLARNARQPVSAYLMYIDKQKAAKKQKLQHRD